MGLMLMLFGQSLSILELVRTDRFWTIVKDDDRFEVFPKSLVFSTGTHTRSDTSQWPACCVTSPFSSCSSGPKFTPWCQVSRREPPHWFFGTLAVDAALHRLSAIYSSENTRDFADVARLLMDHGVDVNKRPGTGMTTPCTTFADWNTVYRWILSVCSLIPHSTGRPWDIRKTSWHPKHIRSN